MHIGFLTPEFPHERLKKSGGLGTSIKNLAEGLVSQDIKVTVFVCWQNSDFEVIESGVRIVSISKKVYPFFNWHFERKRIQKIIQNDIHTTKINLIEAPDWTGISAFMKFSVPLIIRLNGSDGYFCKIENRKQKWKHFFLEKKALKNADAIISVSTYTGKLTKYIFGLRHTIKTIHNSINIDDFKPLHESVNDNQLLYFGTIIRKKGVLELAKTFNLVVEKKHDAELLLIGKDSNDIFENTSTLSLFNRLLSDKAKNKVQYIKEVPYQDIKKYIARASVIVLPSFAEAFPMTWLEALAMEKALVSSNIGWANELMIDGKTGYTVDPKKHEEFANKIIKLLDSNQLRTEFGKNGREHVAANFSTQIITNKNIEHYKNSIALLAESRS